MATGQAVETPKTSAEQLSLAASLDQIEAAINAAHNQIDTMRPREESEDSAESEGALSAAARCQQKLMHLNQRLVQVSELVGTL